MLTRHNFSFKSRSSAIISISLFPNGKNYLKQCIYCCREIVKYLEYFSTASSGPPEHSIKVIKWLYKIYQLLKTANNSTNPCFIARRNQFVDKLHTIFNNLQIYSHGTYTYYIIIINIYYKLLPIYYYFSYICMFYSGKQRCMKTV